MIAEALAGWLLDRVGSGLVDGVKEIVSGSPLEQSLARAIDDGVGVVVSQVPADQRAMLRDSIDEHIREFPWPSIDRDRSLREALETSLRAIVEPLADPELTGTGSSFLDEISVDPEWLLAEFPREIIRAIERVAARDATLAPLAARLDADEIRAELKRLRSPAAPARVNSLPLVPVYFTDRSAELSLLREISQSDPSARTVKLCTVEGMAGVGKSAFAVTAARDLAGRYPDAQLYLDLHGYTPGQPPVSLSGALEALLRVIGVPAEEVPSAEEARISLWRSRTADMSFLLILDNTRDEEVILKLLPGFADCMALITSRRRLIGLPTAYSVTLDPLAGDDASTMLKRMLALPDGPDDATVQAAVAACGYLPLAITLVAGRLRSRSGHGDQGNRKNSAMARVVADLVSSQDGLSNMRAEDRIVMTAFELSYESVTPDAQALLRCLAICPVSDFGKYFAAAVTDSAPRQASYLLDELADHSLLLAGQDDRYQFHDLVRTYVRRIAFERDSEALRQDCSLRTFRYYQECLMKAGPTLEAPGDRGNQERAAGPGTSGALPVFDTYEDAVEWFAEERANLVLAASAAIELACVSDYPELVLVLGDVLRLRGYVDESMAIYDSAVTLSGSRGDVRFEAGVLAGRAELKRVTSRYAESIVDYQLAVTKARETGDLPTEALALRGTATAEWLIGHFEESLAHHERAQEIFQQLGDLWGQNTVLRGMGLILYSLGRYGEARDYNERALAISRQTGNQRGEAGALRGIALAYQSMGDLREAHDCFLQSLSIYTHIEHRIGQIDTLRGAADVEVELHLPDEALPRYQQALAIAEQVGDLSGVAYIRVGIGRLYRQQGRSADALDYLRQAGESARALDEKPAEAYALRELGHTLVAMGSAADGIAALRQAQALYRELDMPSAGEIDELIRSATAAGSPPDGPPDGNEHG